MMVYKLQNSLNQLPCTKNLYYNLELVFPAGRMPIKAVYIGYLLGFEDICYCVSVLLVIKCKVQPMIKCKDYYVGVHKLFYRH